MKKSIIDNIRKILSLTGLELIVLGFGATLYGGIWIYIPTIFQCLVLSTAIQLGIYLLKNFESKYVIVEYLVEITLVQILVLVFGHIFSWYEGTPLWFLLIIGVSTYILSSFLGIISVNSDIRYINKELNRITNLKEVK